MAKRYDMWTDLAFGRLLGVKRFREHTIDLFGDIDGKVVLDVGCDTGRTFSFLLPRGCGRTHHRRVLLDVARARKEQEGWQNVAI